MIGVRIHVVLKRKNPLTCKKTEDDEIDVKVEVAIPKKNKWDDEDVEEDVKESWEDSDEEQESKKPAPVLKKKVPLKQKIAEKLAADEQKKKDLEAKKLAGEDEEEETEEDAYERKERMRRLELEADMMNATDLFSGVSVGKIKESSKGN